MGQGGSIHHGPARAPTGRGELWAVTPPTPDGEQGVDGVEVPDHDPAWAGAALGLGTLLLPLGFQTLQRHRDLAGLWGKAAPRS